MSSPLMFARDGRTLPFVPVTTAALDAIRAHAPARRLPYARSLYLALLEACNAERGDRVALTRTALSEMSRCSSSMITELRPVLEAAGVLKVHERHHANRQIEHEWVVVEPPSESRPPYHTNGGPPHTVCDPPYHTNGGDVPSAVKKNSNEEKEPPLPPKGELRAGEQATIRGLFEQWQAECGHPQSKLTDDRRRKIVARLREGYSSEQVAEAIRGAARNAYVTADGVRHDDLTLICRSGSKLEQFIARASAVPQPGDKQRDDLKARDERVLDRALRGIG